MAVVEVKAVIVGLRYACDTPKCPGELLAEQDPHKIAVYFDWHPTAPKGFLHTCQSCERQYVMTRTYPGYDVRIQPLEDARNEPA